MTRVSSRLLNKKAKEELFTQLSLYIAKANKRNASDFLQVLLTESEQIMLAKRIGVIVLFHAGTSTYQIIEKLHMSSSTIIRMHKAYKDGVYKPITKLFSVNKQDYIRFLGILEVVLRGGLPSRAGKRWALLDKTFARTRRAG